MAAEFSLPDLAAEDALHGHQRSKLERYGETLFTVLRPARYLDDVERSSSVSCTSSLVRTSL